MQLLSKCSETSDSTRSKSLSSFLIDHMLDFRSAPFYVPASFFFSFVFLMMAVLRAETIAPHFGGESSPLSFQALAAVQRQSSSCPLLTSHFLPLFSCCRSDFCPEIDFYCHGTWKDNDTTYTIVYSVEDKKQYCLTHSGSAEEQVLRKMTINSGSCPHPSTGPAFASPSPAFLPQLTAPASVLGSAKRTALVLNILDHGMESFFLAVRTCSPSDH